MRSDPPGEEPADGYADGGGVNRQGRMGKPRETVGRKATGLRSKSSALWGHRANPAKRVAWGEEKQGSKRSFR